MGRPSKSSDMGWKFVPALLAFYVCFRYVGDFPSKQSLVLTFLAFGLLRVYRKLNISQGRRDAFKPFLVWVYPKWEELLPDLSLLSDWSEKTSSRRDAWFAVTSDFNKRFVMPSTLYSVFLHGFTFTVIRKPPLFVVPLGKELRPSAPIYTSLPGLTYWNNRKTFLTELELRERIALPEGWRESEFFKHKWWGTVPELYFRAGDNGYELGLEVKRDWWENHCETGTIGDGLPRSELAKIKIREDSPNKYMDRLRLVIATLPYSAFSSYYEEEAFYSNQKNKQEVEREKELEAHGWKYKEVEASPEFQDPDSRIEHKYFELVTGASSRTQSRRLRRFCHGAYHNL